MYVNYSDEVIKFIELLYKMDLTTLKLHQNYTIKNDIKPLKPLNRLTYIKRLKKINVINIHLILT